MKNEISKWIHISEMGGDPWILPIWNAAHDAERTSKIQKLPKEIIQLGLHISTRINMLPRLIRRINDECIELYKTIKNVGLKYESSKDKSGYAYEIDDNLKYELLIDIDALLFELNSCCELMCNLVRELYSHAGKPLTKNPGLFVKEILENANLQTEWFIDLDMHRNFFIHEGAPYIAISVLNNSKYDLIIMKENLKTFDEPEKFLLLSEINTIVQGFIKSKFIVQQNLVKLFRNLQPTTTHST